MKKFIKGITIALAVVLCGLLGVGAYLANSLPDNYKVTQNSGIQTHNMIPVTAKTENNQTLVEAGILNHPDETYQADLMGISFVASYPAALVEAPAMKTPDESLEAIKAKAFMDPLDQLVQSFPDDFNTCTQPQETAQPSSSEPDAPASEASSPDSSSQEAASSEPAEPAEASGDPSEPAIPANSDNAIELSEFYIPEIPLSQELQAYTYQQCQEKQVSYELVLAMMYHESNYDPSAVRYYEDGSSDSGIMQINSINSQSLYELYGITDLQDPYENILAGVSIISGFVHQYGEHDGLMAYNMGVGGYQNAIANGTYTTTYAQNIMATKSEIEGLRQNA